ncbi:hypothetical protein [Natrialba sp. PRR66]|uniref:DUF7096 domain-containing protein n=1 Tax=Natrialba sp. PRR66 TaxID=3098146 RepID=UPI002B1D3469|nr:hypothetical protein [Natrialba sp. PRR66]
MNNAAPALLALLLVCSLPAMTVVAASPEQEASTDSSANQHYRLQEETQTTPVVIENTTNQLPLSGGIQGSHAETGADLGTSLASSSIQMQVDYEQYALVDQEFAQATNDEQVAMIQAAYNRTQERIESLDERERTAVRAHADGDLSDTELIQVYLETYHEAVALSDLLTDLKVRADQVSDYSLPAQQPRTDQKTLDFYTSTIRTNIADASQSIRSGNTYEYRIQTSQDGYRLSTLSGDSYLIETARFDNRDTTEQNQYRSQDEAQERLKELYPWTLSHRGSHTQDNSVENFYWLSLDHPHGELSTYLDGGTGDIYQEIQVVSADSLPTVESKTKSWNSSFEVTLNKTPAHGPVELTATDVDTGEPIQATIMIDGVEIGETDENGQLEYLPPTEAYDLAINGESSRVSTGIPW